MFCKNCGKEFSDDSKFCPHCGAVVTAVVEQTAENATGEAPKKKEMSPLIKKLIIAVGAVIVIVAAAFFLIKPGECPLDEWVPLPTSAEDFLAKCMDVMLRYEDNELGNSYSGGTDFEYSCPFLRMEGHVSARDGYREYNLLGQRIKGYDACDEVTWYANIDKSNAAEMEQAYHKLKRYMTRRFGRPDINEPGDWYCRWNSIDGSYWSLCKYYIEYGE